MEGVDRSFAIAEKARPAITPYIIGRERWNDGRWALRAYISALAPRRTGLYQGLLIWVARCRTV